MALFKSGNPVLNDNTFNGAIDYQQTEVMTKGGTLNKFGLMMILLFASASFTWKAATEGKDVITWVFGSMILGLIIAIVYRFKMQWGSFLAPVYALLEGVFLGGVSAYYNHAFDKVAPNLIMNAVLLTFGVVIAMFALYRFGVIKATERFKTVVIIATAGIGVFYLIAIIMRMFGVQMPLIHDTGMWGIIFSLVVVGIAALNLVLDFDLIEQGANQRAPKFMEWYGAFALLVTIVWLYLEILRLLAKFASRK